MSAPAWMPLYVADFVVDTLHLSAEETGCYLLLIVHYWQHGGLPDDDEQLARICRIASASEWQRIRTTLARLFLPSWRHKRVDAELAKARDVMQKRVNAGKIGASIRYGKRIANAKQTHRPSPLPPPIKKDTLATQELSEFDEKFWPAYPNKVGKPKARTSFLTARRANSLDAIMAGLERYKRDKPPDRPWLNPATFLNQERFNDEPATTGGNIHGQRRPQPGAQESPTRVAARIARGG